MLNKKALKLWQDTLELVIERMTSPNHYSSHSIGRVESLQDVIDRIPTGEFDWRFDDEKIEENYETERDTLWKNAVEWFIDKINCEETETIKLSYVENKDDIIQGLHSMYRHCQYLEDRAIGYAMADEVLNTLMDEPDYNSNALHSCAKRKKEEMKNGGNQRTSALSVKPQTKAISINM